MVVVTSVPFGLGNLQNLEAAKEALRRGIPVYVLDEVPIESRDFTGGKATVLMRDLKCGGAVFVQGSSDFLSLLHVSGDKLAGLSGQVLSGHVKDRE